MIGSNQIEQYGMPQKMNNNISAILIPYLCLLYPLTIYIFSGSNCEDTWLIQYHYLIKKMKTKEIRNLWGNIISVHHIFLIINYLRSYWLIWRNKMYSIMLYEVQVLGMIHMSIEYLIQ